MLRSAATPSPIVRVLNEDVGRYHRWCTPSILEDQERVHDFYASDISISAGFFGTLVDHTGIFGEAERFAAVVQGAEQAATRLPGGPLLAAALRAPNSVPAFSAASPAGASSAMPAAHGALPGATSALPAGGAAGLAGNSSPSVESVLSQGADQNLYFLELQERISQENRTYSALSNVLKARHETVKNAISNIR